MSLAYTTISRRGTATGAVVKAQTWPLVAPAGLRATTCQK
jgi:hypothetical protein